MMSQDGLAFDVPSLWPGWVARAWSVSRAGVYRFKKRTTLLAIARFSTGPCRDADLADHIRRESKRPIFAAKAIATMGATADYRVPLEPSPRRPVMGENGWLAPHRVGHNQEKTHDGTIVTDKVNEMWGTDMSRPSPSRKKAYVFVAVEHGTQEWSAFTPRIQPIASRRSSRSPRGCIVLRRHRPGRRVGPRQIMAPIMSGDFQDEIECWTSKLRRPSCANPRATASRSASSGP